MKGSDPPQKKRLYAAIQTPSPTKNLPRAATVNSLDVAKSNEVSSNMHDQSIADPPEIVREGRNQHESEATAKISAISLPEASDSNDNSDEELECTQYTCDFLSPNCYNILSNLSTEGDDRPVISNDRMKMPTNNVIISCPPCQRSHVCRRCQIDTYYDPCNDCNASSSVGPIEMKCLICHKKYSNVDYTEFDEDNYIRKPFSN